MKIIYSLSTMQALQKIRSAPKTSEQPLRNSRERKPDEMNTK